MACQLQMYKLPILNINQTQGVWCTLQTVAVTVILNYSGCGVNHVDVD